MAPTFGQLLRELRKAKGLTQRELAELVQLPNRTGIDFTYLSKLENDRLGFRPSEAVIRELARILDGDVDELLLLVARLPKGMQETITRSPRAQQFLRHAGGLTDNEWDRILDIAQRKRRERKK